MGQLGFTLILPEDLHQALSAHLFPGDHDEHGAVIAASVVTGPRGTRLLARDLFLAQDGVDYLPGERGYRMLTPAFITDKILYCRDEQLCYLAVHNHGGHASVAFSDDDLASHERGYPALSKLSRGQIVGGLVFTTGAVAGDLWMPDGERRPLNGARLLGPSVRHLTDKPAPRLAADPRYDRQARLFGERGQELLGKLKVGVIGAGGAGSLIVEYLSRLGIGHLIVADFDRVEISNVPRITGATPSDARPFLTAADRPAWIRKLGARLATRKIDVMRRLARRANPGGIFEGIDGNFAARAVAHKFTDCDYLFLAADSFTARLVFNAMIQQYLIPGVQVGAKVPVNPATGDVGEVFTISRPVRPGVNCLWCNGLIPPAGLQQEAATLQERRAQQYVAEETVHAPSVITLNATAASMAVNDFLFSMLGLTRDDADSGYLSLWPRQREWRATDTRKDSDCPECSRQNGRLGRGASRTLPTTH